MIEIITSIIDPHLLAIELASSREQAIARIKTLLLWNTLNRENSWTQSYLPKSTIRLLESNNSYPADQRLQAALKKFDLADRYSLNDLRRAINSTLSCPPFEAKTSVEDALWSAIETQPDIKATHPEVFYNELVRILLRLILEDKLSQPQKSIPYFCVITTFNTPKINLEAKIDYVLPDNLLKDDAFPFSVTGSTNVFQNQENLLSIIKPETLWGNSKCVYDIQTAITLKCREIQQAAKTYTNYSAIPKFTIGKHFMRSLKDNEAAGFSKFAACTLETIARTLLRIDEDAIKTFREAADSSAARIRTADSAIAKRVHITSAGVALRLMLWHKRDDSFELANVGAKNELVIEQ